MYHFQVAAHIELTLSSFLAHDVLTYPDQNVHYSFENTGIGNLKMVLDLDTRWTSVLRINLCWRYWSRLFTFSAVYHNQIKTFWIDIKNDKMGIVGRRPTSRLHTRLLARLGLREGNTLCRNHTISKSKDFFTLLWQITFIIILLATKLVKNASLAYNWAHTRASQTCSWGSCKAECLYCACVDRSASDRPLTETWGPKTLITQCLATPRDSPRNMASSLVSSEKLADSILFWQN